MLTYNECRPGNLVYYDKIIVEISSATKKSLAVTVPNEREFETMLPIDDVHLFGIRITKELLENKLHFVHYKGPDYPEEATDEFTDGRIIVRVHADSAVLFQPNDFPWAAALNVHMDLVTTIVYVHELQNVYFDLFKVELDVQGLF